MEHWTYTQKPLVEAIKELDRQLPPGAYKAISGGAGGAAGLTDIVPAYAVELISELFGPVGLGWGYDLIDQRDLGGTEKTSKQGRKYTDWQYGVALLLWYKVFDKDGKVLDRAEWPALGGSSNENAEWAAKGAVTNAVGAGWSMAGLQVSVYKGLRSHNKTTPKTPDAPPEPPKDDSPYPPETKAYLASIIPLFVSDETKAQGRAYTKHVLGDRKTAKFTPWEKKHLEAVAKGEKTFLDGTLADAQGELV